MTGSETEKVLFPGCSKMPLPPPKRLPSARLLEAGLRAGRQMQVKLCEIPLAGAPEIVRSEAYLAYAATRKDLPVGRGNAADGLFSAAC